MAASHSLPVQAIENVLKWFPSICQVQLPNESGTGTLVAPNLLMVPTHVVATDAVAKTASAHFENAPHPFSVELDPDVFFVAHPCHTSKKSSERFDEAHQDFTLVALKFKEELQGIRPLPIFTEKRPQLKADVHILHYPIARRDSAGQLEVLSRQQKLSSQIGAVKQVDPFVIHYHCETFGGSSGAPLFTGEGIPYAFHHGICKDANHKECKLAIPLDSVTRYIKEKRIAIDYFIQSQLIDALRKSYGGKTDIQLLLHDRALPIGTTYTRLAIISPAERKEKKEAVKNQTEDIEKEVLPTYESIFQPKEIIEMKDLFEREELRDLEKKRLVVYGSAGIGKTTFSQKIADAWTHEKLWPQFKTLFWIQLRNLNKENYPPRAEKYTIYEILAKECGFNSTTYESLLKDENFRQTTLIVLDGYDELPLEATNSRNATHYLAHLITDLQKAFPHFLITTRPQSVQGFGPLQEFEILGFDRQGIDDYVERFFPADKDQEKKTLLRQLEDPLTYSLCHIPIHLEIFCSLAYEGETFPVGQSLNLGTIYNLLTDWLMRRFFSAHTHKHRDDIRAPGPQNKIEVAAALEALEELAWLALEENRLYLKNTDDNPEITEAFEEKGRNLTIAHVRKIGPFKMENEKEGQFIHLTFQEFFAARYLVRRIKNLAEYPLAKTIIAEKKFNPRYQLVLMMTAGLLAKNEKLLKTFFDLLHQVPRDLGEMRELVLLARCFEECGAKAKAIPQYREFIDRVVATFNDDKIRETFKMELFRRNPHLLAQEKVQNAYITKIQEGDEAFLTLLRRINEVKTSLPPVFIQKLNELLVDAAKEVRIRKIAAGLLLEVAKIGGLSAQTALDHLIAYLKKTEEKDRYEIALFGLGVLAGDKGPLSQQAFDFLLSLLPEKIPRSSDKEFSLMIQSLVHAGTHQNSFSKGVLEKLHFLILSSDADDRTLDNLNRMSDVVQGIGRIAGSKTSSAKKGLEILSTLLRTPAFQSIQWSVALSIRAMTYQKTSLAEKGFEILLSALEESKEDPLLRNNVLHSFFGGLSLPNNVLKRVLMLLDDQTLDVQSRGSVIHILESNTETHSEALLEGCRDLIFNQTFDKNKKNLDCSLLSPGTKMTSEWDIGCILWALGKMMTEGDPCAQKVFTAWINRPQKTDYERRIMISVLVEVIKRGPPFIEQALDELIGLLPCLRSAQWDTRPPITLLQEIVQQGSPLAEKALNALIAWFKGAEEKGNAKAYLPHALAEIAKGSTPLADKALSALTDGLQDLHDIRQLHVVASLEIIVKEGKALPEDIRQQLLGPVLNEGGKTDLSISFASLIAEMAHKEDLLALQALGKFLGFLTDSSSSYPVKYAATQALKKVSKEKLFSFRDELHALFLAPQNEPSVYEFTEKLIDPYLGSFQLESEDQAPLLIQICNRYGRAIYQEDGDYFISTQRNVIKVRQSN